MKTLTAQVHITLYVKSKYDGIFKEGLVRNFPLLATDTCTIKLLPTIHRKKKCLWSSQSFLRPELTCPVRGLESLQGSTLLQRFTTSL